MVPLTAGTSEATVKSFNKGRFARVIGAMGAAMLMAMSPAAVVGTGVPVAYAQDDDPVPVVTETETEVVTVEEEAVPVPAEEPESAPADEPVEVPADGEQPESEDPVEDAEAVHSAPVPAPRIARQAITTAGTVTDENLMAEFGLEEVPAICVDPVDTLWASSERFAFEYDKDGNPTGRQITLSPNVNRDQYGSAIAIDQTGTRMYAANYCNDQNNRPNIVLREYDVATGATLRNIETDIPKTQVNSQISTTYRVLNSLSMTPVIEHLYLGGEFQTALWKVRISDGVATVVSGNTARHATLGWAGDFIKLSNGGYLGARKDGRIVYWPGEISGDPQVVGRFRIGTPQSWTEVPRSMGLAVVDGIV